MLEGLYTLRLTLALLALTTSRPNNQACLQRWDPLIWVLLPVEFFDLCRLDDSHVTAAAALLALASLPSVLAEAAAAALLAVAALPSVLADAAAAALLADPAQPSVLADATATAVLAPAALPPVLAHAAAAALLTQAAPPPVLADATATAVLAVAALPPVLAEAPAAAVLAVAAPPTVLAHAAAAAVLAAAALPPVLADAAAAAVLAVVALPPVLALLVHHAHTLYTRSGGATRLYRSTTRALPYYTQISTANTARLSTVLLSLFAPLISPSPTPLLPFFVFFSCTSISSLFLETFIIRNYNLANQRQTRKTKVK